MKRILYVLINAVLVFGMLVTSVSAKGPYVTGSVNTITAPLKNEGDPSTETFTLNLNVVWVNKDGGNNHPTGETLINSLKLVRFVLDGSNEIEKNESILPSNAKYTPDSTDSNKGTVSCSITAPLKDDRGRDINYAIRHHDIINDPANMLGYTLTVGTDGTYVYTEKSDASGQPSGGNEQPAENPEYDIVNGLKIYKTLDLAKLSTTNVNLSIGGTRNNDGTLNGATKIIENNVIVMPQGYKIRGGEESTGSLSYNTQGYHFYNGATLTYQLPQGIAPLAGQTGIVMDGSMEIGTYEIPESTGLVQIKLKDDLFDAGYGIINGGGISFDGHIVTIDAGGDHNQQFVFGSITLEIPVEEIVNNTLELNLSKTSDKTHLVISSENPQGYTVPYIEYLLTADTIGNGPSKTVENVVLNDIFTDDGNYIDRKEVVKVVKTVNGQSTEISGDALESDTNLKYNVDGSISYKVGDMAYNQKVQVYVRAYIKDSFFSESAPGVTRVIKNKLLATSNNVNKNPVEVTDTFNAGVNLSKNTQNTPSGEFYRRETVNNVEKGFIIYEVVASAPNTNLWDLTDVNLKDNFVNTENDNKGKDYIDGYGDFEYWNNDTQTWETYNGYPLISSSSNAGDATMKWDIDKLEPGQSFKVRYKVYIKDELFTASTAGTVSRKLKNVAKIYEGNTDIVSRETTQTLSKEWVTKTGTVNLQNNSIDYKVEVNKKTNNSPMIDASIDIKDIIKLPESLTYDGNLVIKWYDPNVSGSSENNPVGSYTFSFPSGVNHVWTWSAFSNTIEVGDKTPNEQNNNVTYQTITASSSTGSTGIKNQGQYTYVATYSAKLADGGYIGRVNIKNDASTGVNPGGDMLSYDHETSSQKNENLYHSISKEFVRRDDKVVTWKSKLEWNIRPGYSYEDWSENGYMYFTAEQLKNISFSIYDNVSKTSTPVSNIEYKLYASTTIDGTGYIELNAESLENNTTHYKRFKIVFEEVGDASLTNPLEITYQSTILTNGLNEGAQREYKNIGKMTDTAGHYDDAFATCKYRKDKKLEKKYANFKEKENRLTWDITVNQTGSMSGDITLVDLMPEGLEYVDVSIKEYGNDYKKAGVTIPTVSYIGSETLEKEVINDGIKEMVPDGNKVSFKITGLTDTGENAHMAEDTDYNNHYVTITVTTKIKDSLLLNTSGNGALNITFLNKVYIEGENDNVKTATKEVNTKTLSKAIKYDSSTYPYALFTVVLNEHGYDLLTGDNEDAQYVLVYDRMSLNLYPDVSSIKVTEIETNKVLAEGEGKDYKVLTVIDNSENHGFVLEVPDDRPLKIEYRCFVGGELGSNASISNTVDYTGQTEEEPQIKRDVTVYTSKAYADGDYGFSIEKFNAENVSEKLNGAKFELFEVSVETDNGGNKSLAYAPVNEPVDSTKANYIAVTGQYVKGVASFEKLDENKVYAFKEVETPAGFYTKETGYRYVAFHNDSITDDMAALGINREGSVVMKGHKFYIQNYPGVIELEKSFVGTRAEGSYSFGLFELDARGSIAGLKDVKEIAVVRGEDGTLTQSDKIEFRNVKIDKTYTIKEIVANDNGNYEKGGVKYNIPEVGADGAVGLNDTRYVATYKLTNKEGSQSDENLNLSLDENYHDAVVEVINTEMPAQVRFHFYKELTNAQKVANQFNFILYTLDSEGKVNVIDRKSNDQSGEVVFDLIEYSDEDFDSEDQTEKQLVYYIREVIDVSEEKADERHNDGILYDDSIVKLTVDLNRENGLLVNSVKAEKIDTVKNDEGNDVDTVTELIIVSEIVNDTEQYTDWLIQGASSLVMKNDNSNISYKTKDGVVNEIHPAFVNEFTGTALIEKRDKVATDKKLENAVFVLFVKTGVDDEGSPIGVAYSTDEDGEPVTYTTDENGKIYLENMPEGDYYFLEVSSPTGYAITDGSPIEFRITWDQEKGFADYKTVVDNTPIELHVSKVDLWDEEKFVVGAEIELYAAEEIVDEAGRHVYDDGELIREWTVCEDDPETEDVDESNLTLDIGPMLVVNKTYRIREKFAPAGYLICKDATFKVTVDEDGKTQIEFVDLDVDESEEPEISPLIDGDQIPNEEEPENENVHEFVDGVLLIKDDTTKIVVHKTSPNKRHYLRDAHLQIIDSEGKVVLDFVTNGKPVEVNALLNAGDTYTLHEVKAPGGYHRAKDVKFTVNFDGEVQNIEMIDINIPIIPNTGVDYDVPVMVGVIGVLMIALGVLKKFNFR